MISAHLRQQGSALLVSLMILIILTLIAVTAINTSIVNTRIVNNTQSQYTLERKVQSGIDVAMGSASIFYAPATVIESISGSGYTLAVTVSKPTCLRAKAATGYSARVTSSAANIIPQDTTWDVVATATDPTTGATAEVHQGVSVRMRAGNCP